jgi:lysophospholipase L1-like esterase
MKQILSYRLLRFLLLLLFLGFLSDGIIAQPFANEIAAFRKQDSVSRPPSGAILLVGSSSFRMWKDVQAYFPGYTIINRAFGGSTLQDVIHYARDVIQPYRPRQILIYCGENDLASSDTITPAIVLKRFEILYYLIRKHYKKVPVAFVSIKPSPSRQHLMPKMVEANTLIQNFLKGKRKTRYIDVYSKMLKPDGTPMDDIFIADKLHMNAKGYAIWQKAIEPHLLKD